MDSNPSPVWRLVAWIQKEKSSDLVTLLTFTARDVISPILPDSLNLVRILSAFKLNVKYSETFNLREPSGQPLVIYVSNITPLFEKW